MKKSVLIFVFTFSAFNLFSQQWLGSTGPSGRIFREDEISSQKGTGISRVTLSSMWTNTGISYSFGFLGFNLERTNLSNPLVPWNFYTDGANNGSAAIFANVGGDLLFAVKPSTGGIPGTTSDQDISNKIKMLIYRDGQVVIGNNLGTWGAPMTWPGNYKLFVQSGILTEKVKVSVLNTSEWADHVFHNNYKPLSLKNLEKFIVTNKHLPGIPSATEVVKEGVDLGKMDAKLLEKIEELTLYIIELNKKLEKQQKEINALKNR